MAISDLLRSCPLFFELYDREVERIVEYCAVYSFAAGQAVFREGDEGDQVFVILSGSASVRRRTPDGTTTLMTLRAGDVFGEMVLVDERHRSAEVVAEVDADVLEIRYDDIFAIFKQDPKIFGLILLNLSRLLAKRVRSANQIILQLKDAAARPGGLGRQSA